MEPAPAHYLQKRRAECDLIMYTDGLRKIRMALNPVDLEWYYSVIDVVGLVCLQENPTKARKYWNQLKSRLRRLQSKMIWRKESGIQEFELVTKILKNCHQLKMSGKDNKSYQTDVMRPEILEDLIRFIPSRNKRFFERQYNKIVNEIINPPVEIIY